MKTVNLIGLRETAAIIYVIHDPKLKGHTVEDVLEDIEVILLDQSTKQMCHIYGPPIWDFYIFDVHYRLWR